MRRRSRRFNHQNYVVVYTTSSLRFVERRDDMDASIDFFVNNIEEGHDFGNKARLYKFTEEQRRRETRFVVAA